VHVEAGLRSYDRAMPEELNRRVIGVLADLHCEPTEQAVRNLRREGVPGESILLTGNTIVEVTNEMAPDDMAARSIAADLGAEPNQYILATIHRPENTDDPQRLQAIVDELEGSACPCCPRCTPGPDLPPSGAASLPRWTGSRSSPRPITAPSSAWPVTPA
jgi:UDP-N-acetylglucosamine 2-epimerase (non-hydrolysing)